jgi:AhpD family alkylhydroperoxidase
MMRLDYKQAAPQGFKPFITQIEHAKNSGLEETLLHMVYLRVSQINGCSYCIDQHWQDAVKSGVDARKLNAVVIWREAPFFSERERAALGWAEAVTRLMWRRVDDHAFEVVKPHFSEPELAELTYAIANMNALNRVAIAFHKTPSV